MSNPGMVVTELPAALHRRAKIAAVTQGILLRELIAQAVEAHLAAQEAPAATPAAKTAKKRPRSLTPTERQEDAVAAAALDHAERIAKFGPPSDEKPTVEALGKKVDFTPDEDPWPNPFGASR